MPGLRSVERKGIFYAVGTVAGERIRKSLGTRDRRQAQELCAQYEAKLWKRRSYGEESVRTFEEAVTLYVEAGGEPTYLQPLLRRFRGRVLGTIKPEEIRQAARALGPNKKNSTRNRQVIVPACAVINHAAEAGWCPKISVTRFAVEKSRRITVDRVWIDAFLAQADCDGLPHLAAAILFMWQTGTRVSETSRVLPEHIDLQARVVLLERTKTAQWERRHISHELMIRLANLSMSDAKPVFGYASRFGIRARMKAVCRRAGLPFVPPHQAGRHSFASNALSMGATTKEIMEAGGWKTARLVLETYAHANEAGKTIADRFDANLAQSKPMAAQVIHKKGKK
jgi:integrase